MNNLIKCTTSFMIGFYIAFVLTLSVTGYIIVEGFVSKHMLNRTSFYMDGKIYEVKKN
jgi:uncharacterized membrane protein